MYSPFVAFRSFFKFSCEHGKDTRNEVNLLSLPSPFWFSRYFLGQKNIVEGLERLNLFIDSLRVQIDQITP